MTIPLQTELPEIPSPGQLTPDAKTWLGGDEFSLNAVGAPADLISFCNQLQVEQ